MSVCVTDDLGFFINEPCIKTRPLDFAVNQNFSILAKSYFSFSVGSLTNWRLVLRECGEKLWCREAAGPAPPQLAEKIISCEHREEVIPVVL